MDSEYDENIARISAMLLNGEILIAQQRQLVELMKARGGPIGELQRSLDLMLEIHRTIQSMLNTYRSLFRGRLH